MKKDILDFVAGMGYTQDERDLIEVQENFLREKRLVGTFTSAGLALPEDMVTWADGKFDVFVEQDRTIIVRKGKMQASCRPKSKQGILQHGWLRAKLIRAGYDFKDKIQFVYHHGTDEYVGKV